MKIQRSTECAMRILFHLYHREDKNHMFTAEEISRATGISYSLFHKVANQLKEAGYIVSVQGRYGGYRLEDAERTISAYEVIAAMQGEVQIGATVSAEANCSIQACLYEIRNAMIETLSKQYIHRNDAADTE